MNGYIFIKQKQLNWALNKGINLQNKDKNMNGTFYTQKLEDNLYEQLLPETRNSFLNASGGELNQCEDTPCKLQALHSSAALVINIFQYWKKIREIENIIHIFDHKHNTTNYQMYFEKEFVIDKIFPFPPTLDVIFTLKEKNQVIAIESKFSEPYYGANPGLKEKYFVDEVISKLWNDIPSIKRIAEDICPEDKKFQYLHVAQLIKHILGLKKSYKKKDFVLLYLWYNVPGKEGYYHQKEIEFIKELFQKDGINFKSMTYQELIIQLAEKFRKIHYNYIKYITERYL